MGERSYAAAAQEAGVDGLIMVNLPPEEADLLQSELLQHQQNLIFLVAPTTTQKRAEQILKAASGFVYYVSLKGITGASNLDPEAVRAKVTSLQARTALPVFVGFGIKDGATAKAIGEVADGVVVGSALVRTMGEHAADVKSARNDGGDDGLDLIDAQLKTQVNELRVALDSLRPDG